MTERLAGDQEVVSANWFAESFKGCANPSRVLGVVWGEVQNLKRTGQEGRDSFGIRLREPPGHPRTFNQDGSGP
jgi:hypothetical protein